jgi:hypothetical protein
MIAEGCHSDYAVPVDGSQAAQFAGYAALAAEFAVEVMGGWWLHHEIRKAAFRTPIPRGAHVFESFRVPIQ